jgi:hypothetical protein
VNPPGDTSPQSAIPPRTPPTHPVTDALGRLPAPSLVATPGRRVALHLVSLAVMAPWPLLGILLTHTRFDQESEAFMLFGGVTLFPLMLLALFGPPSEELLIAVLMLVWIAVALLPGVLFRRRLRSRAAIGVLLGAQSIFALLQAAMGALLIVGKSV